jgi:hypothetical protein
MKKAFFLTLLLFGLVGTLFAEGLYFRQIRPLLASNAPTEFTFKVLRNGKPDEVKPKSVPGSTLAGKKGLAADETKINRHYRLVPVTVTTGNSGRVHPSGKKDDIMMNSVILRIRMAGEEWWLLETNLNLDDLGNLEPFKMNLPVDVTRTYYFEMFYKRSDGKFYGDYVYIRGADLVRQGGGNFAFKLTANGFRYYESRGYVFPDKARVTILGTDGKPFFNQEIEVEAKWSPEKDYRMLYSSDINKCYFEGPDQPTENDITFVLTVEALKDGEPEILTFQVRETLFWTRSNKGFFERNRYQFTWWFDSEGQLTKLAL